jgi:hypothetical protein
VECVCNDKKYEKKIHTQTTPSLPRSLTCVSVRPEPCACKTSVRCRARAAHSSPRRERASAPHPPTSEGRLAQNTQTETVTLSMMIFLRHRCPHLPKLLHQFTVRSPRQPAKPAAHLSPAALICVHKAKCHVAVISSPCCAHTSLECGHTVNDIGRV